MTQNYDPGVYLNFNDQSELPVVPAGTTVALLGGATKGDLDKAIPIGDEAEMLRKIGKPLTTDYGVQAARQLLQRGGSLYYVRVSDGTHAKADVDLGKNPEDYGCTPPAPPDVLTFEALSAGTWGNDISAAIEMEEGITYSQTLLSGALIPPTLVKTLYATNANIVPGTVTITATWVETDGTPGIDVITVNAAGVFGSGTYLNSASTSTLDLQSGALSLTHTLAAIPNVVASSMSVIATHRISQFEQTTQGFAIAGTLTVNSDFTLTTLKQDYYASTHRIQPGSLCLMAVNAGTGIVVPNGVVWDDGLGVITFPASVLDDGAPLNPVPLSIDYDTGVLRFPGATTTIHNKTGVVITIYAIYRDPFFDVVVMAPVDNAGTLGEVERFEDCCQESTSPRYVEKRVNDGDPEESLRKSEYITADSVAGCLPEVGTFALTGGLDGISGLTDSDYIGTYTSGVPSGLKVIDNPEEYGIDLLAVPGVSSASVIAALAQLCESRVDTFFFADPPFGLTASEVEDWTDGTGAYSHAQFNTFHGSTYWSWMKAADPYNKQDIWLPPSAFIPGVFTYSDRQGGAYLPAAGTNRGRVVGATDIELNPSDAERDRFAKFPSIINPIVNLSPGGLTVWNSFTMYRKSTALRENYVVRMAKRIGRTAIVSCRSLVFELNTPELWGRLISLLKPYLDGLVTAGAAESLSVQCDSTLNTDLTKNQKTVVAKIFYVPYHAAKRIEISLTVTNSGQGSFTIS